MVSVLTLISQSYFISEKHFKESWIEVPTTQKTSQFVLKIEGRPLPQLQRRDQNGRPQRSINHYALRSPKIRIKTFSTKADPQPDLE